MIRRKEERLCEIGEGNGGQFYKNHILNGPEEMYNKGRLFGHMVLPAGVGIKYHEHHGDAEAYYILKGQGEYNDNGEIKQVQAGDVTITWEGEGHSLTNTGSEDLEFIALIYYK